MADAVDPTDVVLAFLDAVPDSIRSGTHANLITLIAPDTLSGDLDVIRAVRDYLRADGGKLRRSSAAIVVTLLIDYWAGFNPYAKNDFLFDLAVEERSAALMRLAEMAPLQNRDHDNASTAWRAIRASALTNEALRRFQISALEF